MAGLYPATQRARVGARWKLSFDRAADPFLRCADAQLLGGRVKPGHDEI
jgi:hypothetical protein